MGLSVKLENIHLLLFFLWFSPIFFIFLKKLLIKFWLERIQLDKDVSSFSKLTFRNPRDMYCADLPSLVVVGGHLHRS